MQNNLYFSYKDPKNETNSQMNNLWIVNENLFVAPLLPLLEEIRLFVKLSKEVVIVNFADFPIGFFFLVFFLSSSSIFFIQKCWIWFSVFLGFYNFPERHLVLLRTLAAELGDVIFTRPWDSMSNSGDLTIEMMDRTGKSLLILYNDKTVVDGET